MPTATSSTGIITGAGSTTLLVEQEPPVVGERLPGVEAPSRCNVPGTTSPTASGRCAMPAYST